jgi:transcriptional regulator with XRE-family HTH domain
MLMKNSDAERVELVARQLGARIRDARLAQKITLSALTKPTGLSAGFLSRLERGETNASISNLISISTALHIPLRDFFEDADVPKGPEYVLTRVQERKNKSPLVANGYTYHPSSGDLPDQQMSAFELTFPPGEKLRPKLVTHEGEEILYLLEGTIEFMIGDHAFLMKAGDCVHFNCKQPHMGRNVGKTAARLLMVVTPMNSLATN